MADLREAISLIDKGLRPDLAAMAVAAYGTILCDLRRTAEALAVLRAFHEHYPGFDDHLLLAELNLLEGGLLIFSDRQDVAEARLESARREFFALGQDREALLASLSLALLYLLDGRRAPALRHLVEKSIEPLSRSRHLPAVARRPLSRFSAAVEDGTATAALAGALREYIATLQFPPDEEPSAATGGGGPTDDAKDRRRARP